MSTATVQQGNYISDIILNSTGLISNWNLVLEANNFDSWTPDLYNGQIIQIPDTVNNDAAAIASLQDYPANNFSIPDIYEQINEVFAMLAGVVPGIAPVIVPTIQDTNTYVEILNGVGIVDLVLNSTGDIINWESVLIQNGFSTWTPDFYNGELIAIPADVSPNLNVFRALNIYPANNFSVPDIEAQIEAVFDALNNPVSDWILYNPDGQWNDENHYWRDMAFWLD